MVSKRSETNRANAQRSTGPKSLAGKQRAAQNALRHGLNSIVIDPEQSIYAENLSKAFQVEMHDMDTSMAAALAAAIARRNQIARVVSLIIATEFEKTDPALSISVREDLATLAALPRLVPIADAERRASARIRKLLRKLEAMDN